MSEEQPALPAGCTIEERVIVETGTVKVIDQRCGVQLPGKQGWHVAGFMNQPAKERELFQCDNKSHTAIKEKNDPLMPLLKRGELFKFNHGQSDIRDVQTNAKGEKKKKTKGRRCCFFRLDPKYQALLPEEFARRCAEQDRPLLKIFADTSRDIDTRKRALGKLVRNFYDTHKRQEGMLATFLWSNVDNAEALALLKKAVFENKTLSRAEVVQCVSPLVDEDEPVELLHSDDVGSLLAAPSQEQCFSDMNGTSSDLLDFGSGNGDEDIDNDALLENFPLDGGASANHAPLGDALSVLAQEQNYVQMKLQKEPDAPEWIVRHEIVSLGVLESEVQQYAEQMEHVNADMCPSEKLFKLTLLKHYSNHVQSDMAKHQKWKMKLDAYNWTQCRSSDADTAWWQAFQESHPGGQFRKFRPSDLPQTEDDVFADLYKIYLHFWAPASQEEKDQEETQPERNAIGAEMTLEENRRPGQAEASGIVPDTPETEHLKVQYRAALEHKLRQLAVVCKDENGLAALKLGVAIYIQQRPLEGNAGEFWVKTQQFMNAQDRLMGGLEQNMFLLAYFLVRHHHLDAESARYLIKAVGVSSALAFSMRDGTLNPYQPVEELLKRWPSHSPESVQTCLERLAPAVVLDDMARLSNVVVAS